MLLLFPATYIGQTILYVTHDQSEALTLADKIAIMRDGKLLQFSDTQEIFEHPQNDFVGWFLGNPGMNFIPCEYKKKDYYILDADVFRYQTDAIKLKEIAAGSAKPETLYPKPGWTERNVQIPSLYLRE